MKLCRNSVVTFCDEIWVLAVNSHTKCVRALSVVSCLNMILFSDTVRMKAKSDKLVRELLREGFNRNQHLK